VTETERLGLLLKDLLDLSRLEDPTAVLDTIADISHVADNEVDALKTAADARNIGLSSSIEPGVRVRGDDKQLGLMIRNLLDNAIAYTPEGGTVSIEVAAKGREAHITVVDNGMGIALRDQARVFERFFRVDAARTRDRGGTGLGLAIVKHVADLCGGHVGVVSHIGEGSEFWVHLPLEGEPNRSPPSNE
jgi:signal transduction histidine kinase